ncbi:unnamed protein product [Musa textilis]
MPCMESASVMEARDEVSNLECIRVTCDIVCNPEPSSETCHGEHNEVIETKNVTAENIIGESENPIVQALDVPNVEATFVVEVRDEVGNVEYAQPTYDTICNPELSSETCYGKHNELTEAKNITAESSDAELNFQNLVETKNESTEVVDVPSAESAPVTEVRDELRNVVYVQPTSVIICNPSHLLEHAMVNIMK